MSDPAVIADRERYAEVGREYRQLEGAHGLAAEYRKLSDDLEGARELLAEDGDDPELKAVVAEAPGRLEELGEEIRLAMVERDPNDDKNVIVEIRAGTGGDEAALFAGDLHKMLTRYAEARGYCDRGALVLGRGPGRLQGEHLRDQGRRRLLGVQVRGRDPPGAAGAEDRVPGSHPHLDRYGRGAAGGRGGGGGARPERPRYRHLPLDRARRPVGQHDRLGRADHAPAERDRRLDAGREVPAPEPREGDAGAARASARAPARGAAGRGRGRAQGPGRDRASARRRSAPTTSPRIGSPTTA